MLHLPDRSCFPVHLLTHFLTNCWLFLFWLAFLLRSCRLQCLFFCWWYLSLSASWYALSSSPSNLALVMRLTGR